MAVYPNIITVNSGLNLISRASAEKKTLIYTRMALGDGEVGSKNIMQLTSLISPKLNELSITNTIDHNNGHYEIEARVDNSALEEGFWAREMGVYAKLEGDSKDVLFAYTNGGNIVPFVNSKQFPDHQLCQIDVIVGNAKSLTAIIDGKTMVTEARLVSTINNHNSDANAHKVVFDKFVKDVKIKSKAENSFIVTKGDNSTTTITINNVEHASNADTAGVANAVKALHDGQIKYDLSNCPANAATSIFYNWAAVDRTRRIQEYVFYDGTGSGTMSALKAKWLTGDVKGNADTSSVSNSIAISRGNEIVLTGTPNNQEQVWLGYRSEGYTGSPIKKWKFGDLKFGLAAVEASEFIGPATVLKGIYTQNGGKQPLGYFGRNTVGALMSNESVMGDTSYKNWLYMDHYEGSDAGGATAFGISRTGTRAFIARSNSDRGPIVDSAELLTTKGGHTVSGSMTFNGTVTTKSGIIIPTRSRGDNTTYAASTAFVQDAINALVNGSPGALDTLKELAAALGNDANFAATITKALGLKAPLASPTFTGTVTGPTPSSSANNTQFATTAWVLSRISALATGPIIGDVSSANGWWIKIPCQGFNLLIQGGKSGISDNTIFYADIHYPVRATPLILVSDNIDYDNTSNWQVESPQGTFLMNYLTDTTARIVFNKQGIGSFWWWGIFKA